MKFSGPLSKLSKEQLQKLSEQRGDGRGDKVVAQIKNGEAIRNKKKEK